jgi:hypothetical protein
MAEYNLQPNEAVLLKEEHVRHGGTFASYTDALILTNLNLVLVEKGFFGKSKGIRVFPINEVKVDSGQAQAVVGQDKNGTPALEVYFMDGEEKFTFQSGGKKKILTWAAGINQVVTGQEPPVEQETGMALPGTELVAGLLKDTIGVFKAKLGSKTDAPVKVAGKCTACGAPISGTCGSAVACEYCGTVQQL